MVKRALIIGGAALALIGLMVISMRQGGGEGRDVYTHQVERSEIARTVRASGTVHPRLQVIISPRVPGEIERLFVEEGQYVEAGAPFAQLDQELFEAALQRAHAVLESSQSQAARAEVRLEHARLTGSRAARLRDERVLAQDQLDQALLEQRSAELELASARSAAAQARADLQRAVEDLRRTLIRAPISGTVVALEVKEGEVVIAGTTNLPGSRIGTLADLSEILVEIEVDETDVIHVRPGQSSEVTLEAVPDVSYAARVVEVGSSGYRPQRQPDLTVFRVKLLLEAPDENLKPGMSARAQIATARHAEALVVPIQAVVRRAPRGEEAADRDADRVNVVFVAEEGKAVQREVEVGLSDITHAEIRFGIEEGEQVITGPYRTLRDLRDGDAIQAREEPGAAGRDEGAERAEPGIPAQEPDEWP